MECTLGLCFKDFAVVASDATSARSILVMKDDYDKHFRLSDKLLMAVTGESGDTAQFAEFIEKNVQLYKMRNSYELSPSSAASFTRRNLADYLRSRTPYNVNLLIAGFDPEKTECEMYAMDYLAANIRVPFAAHGYGGFFATALMDREYRADMTENEAYDLILECVKEVQKRLVISLPAFNVHVVDKDGIRKKDAITIKNIKA